MYKIDFLGAQLEFNCIKMIIVHDYSEVIKAKVEYPYSTIFIQTSEL